MDEYPMLSEGERMTLHFMGWEELTEGQRKTIYDLSMTLNISTSEVFTMVKILATGPIKKTFPVWWKIEE